MARPHLRGPTPDETLTRLDDAEHRRLVDPTPPHRHGKRGTAAKPTSHRSHPDSPTAMAHLFPSPFSYKSHSPSPLPLAINSTLVHVGALSIAHRTTRQGRTPSFPLPLLLPTTPANPTPLLAAELANLACRRTECLKARTHLCAPLQHPLPPASHAHDPFPCTARPSLLRQTCVACPAATARRLPIPQLHRAPSYPDEHPATSMATRVRHQSRLRPAFSVPPPRVHRGLRGREPNPQPFPVGK